MIVYIKNTKAKKYYKVDMCDLPRSLRGDVWSCGSLISIGLTAEYDRDVAWDVIDSGKAIEISFEEWNHSGCISSCKLRGQSECRW